MGIDVGKLQRSIRACIANGKRLMEDAELSIGQPSTGVALVLAAQEECAKAFVLALVRDGIVPWTDDVRRSLSVHQCKHLVTIIMEWLLTVNERRLAEPAPWTDQSDPPRHLPRDVATAMNIYRHEMVERIGRRYPEHYPEWRGRARSIADGERERKKQAALYVDVGPDGSPTSIPHASQKTFDEEFLRVKALIEFAEDVDRRCIFAYREYELFAQISRAMFADLAADPENGSCPEESFPSGIPGVNFVQKTIIVAAVVQPEHDTPPGEPSTD